MVTMFALTFLSFSTFTLNFRQDIHPDSEENVASVREQLSTESDREPQNFLPRASQRNDGHLTCPICLGQVAFGVETNCGHVFCGNI